MSSDFSVDINSNKNKNTCPICSSDTIQRCSTLFGKLALFGLWWCGIGYLIYRLTQYDYCEFCYQTNFFVKARENRIKKLLIDDQSLVEPPPVDQELLRNRIGISDNKL